MIKAGRTGSITHNANPMRLISFLLFLGLSQGLFLPLTAQTYSDDPRVEQKMQGMHDLFELSQDQSDQILAIFTDVAGQLDVIRPLRNTDRTAFRQQKRQIIQQMETQVLTVLDAQQAADFQAMRAEYRQRKQAGRSNGSAASKPEKEVYVETIPSGAAGTTQLVEDTEWVGEESTETTESYGETSISQPSLLEKTLDFFYEDVLMPAVRKKK